MADDLRDSQRKRLWIVGLILVLLILVTVLLLVSRLVDKQISDPVQFITGNLLNILIFLAIVAQVHIYRKQRDIMKQQWQAMDQSLKRTDAVIESMKEQAKLMKIQAEAALKGAQAAEDSVKAAERSLHVSQRAYVGVERHPELAWSNDIQPIVIITFANTGHTPTRKAELIFEFQIGGEIFEDRKAGFTIGAHARKSFDCWWSGSTIDKERLAFINGNESVFFFEIELRYSDVWDEIYDSVRSRYVYDPKTLSMEEFYEGEKRHQKENQIWNNLIDPNAN